MQQNKKVFILAGEESGDIYAGEIAKNLKIINENVEIYGIGGENLAKQGANLIEHIKNLSFLGIFEVVKHIPNVYKILNKVKNFLKEFQPDYIILIDFPDFNFRIAKFAKNIGLKVYYFISPQIWAWRRGRVKFIKKYIDKIFVIFPFEEDFYKYYGINATFVGHPLAKKIKNFIQTKSSNSNKNILTLGILPGSRIKEITNHLPIIVNAIKKIKNINVIVGIAKLLDVNIVKSYFKELKNVKFIHGNSYDVMYNSDIIVATSGTVTLESAMFGKPLIIVYRVNFFSYLLGRLLIKVKFIGMPNLLLGEMNNPELIQFNFNSGKLYIEIMKMIKNKEKTDLIANKNSKILNLLYKENIFDFLKSL